MPIEVQFEALAHHSLVHRRDRALEGRAGVGDEDIEPAEAADDGGDGGLHGCRIGHIAGNAERCLANA